MVSCRRCGVKCLGNSTVLGKKGQGKRAMSVLDYRMSHNRLDHCFHWLASGFREAPKAARYEKVLVEHFVSPVSAHPQIPNVA